MAWGFSTLAIAVLLCPHALAAGCGSHSCIQDDTSLLQVASSVTPANQRSEQYPVVLEAEEEAEALQKEVSQHYHPSPQAPEEETKTLKIEYSEDSERTAAEEFTNFVATNALSTEVWESRMIDTNGNELQSLPHEDRTAWPLTFLFARKSETSSSSQENLGLLEATDSMTDIDESGGCIPDTYCHGTAPFCGGNTKDCRASIGRYPLKYGKKCPAGGGGTCWFGWKIQCQTCKTKAKPVKDPKPSKVDKLITKIKKLIPWKKPAPALTKKAGAGANIVTVADAQMAVTKAEAAFAAAHGDYVNATGEKQHTYDHIQKLLHYENSAKYNYTFFRNAAINFAAKKTRLNQTALKLLRQMADAKVEERIHALAAQNMKIEAENARMNITYHQKVLIDKEEALDWYRAQYDNSLHARDRSRVKLWQAQALAAQKAAQAKLLANVQNSVSVQNVAAAHQQELATNKEKAYMESSGLKSPAEVPAWVGR